MPPRVFQRAFGEPPEALKALLAGSPCARARSCDLNMTPREMDYGAMNHAQETWHKFSWAPLVRAAGIWTAIFFVALYLHDRFFPQ